LPYRVLDRLAEALQRLENLGSALGISGVDDVDLGAGSVVLVRRETQLNAQFPRCARNELGVELARKSRTAAPSMDVSAPESFTARRSVDPGCAEGSEAAMTRLAGTAAAAPAIRLRRQKPRRFMGLTPSAYSCEESIIRVLHTIMYLSGI
jgi:hypothetical protein